MATTGLMDAIAFMKDAENCEAQQKSSEAIYMYGIALGYFAKYTTHNEVDQVKVRFINKKIKECVDKLAKLKTDTVKSEEKYGEAFTASDVTFKDVCGNEGIKEDLQMALLKSATFSKMFTALDLKPSKTFLLYGPPGTGKATIAKAAANEAPGTRFIHITPSDILERFIGESEKSLRRIFEMARTMLPCIIFCNEIDFFAVKRQERDNMRGLTSELFLQLDAMPDGIVFIAATNCPQHLDSALMHRFDNIFFVGLPEEQERKLIFEKNITGKDLRFDLYAGKTNRYSPADIRDVCSNAKLTAVKRFITDNSSSNCDEQCQCEKCTPVLLHSDVMHAINVSRPTCDDTQLQEIKNFAKTMGIDSDRFIDYTDEEPRRYTCCDCFHGFFSHFFL